VVRGKCAPGGCTTISWNTSPGATGCTTADQTPPGGQCRHQQVCVVGYGATLECITNCNPTCGETTTFKACVSATADRGPFTLTLAGDDGTSQTQSTVGDPSGITCLSFDVTPTLSPKTTYTLTVTDRTGCTRTATASVNIQTTTATITPPSAPGCNGVLVYGASVANRTGCSFTWTIDGASVATFAAGGAADDARIARVKGTNSETLEFRALDNACHTIRVSASCGGCTAATTKTAKQCVGNTLNCQ
jgi:hypothetical protein